MRSQKEYLFLGRPSEELEAGRCRLVGIDVNAGVYLGVFELDRVMEGVPGDDGLLAFRVNQDGKMTRRMSGCGDQSHLGCDVETRGWYPWR